MYIRPYEKKDWEKVEQINKEYLPRVPVLYRFPYVRQYYMDLADGYHHCIDFKDGCKIKLVSVDKITDDLEDVEEKLEEVYSKKVFDL